MKYVALAFAAGIAVGYVSFSNIQPTPIIQDLSPSYPTYVDLTEYPEYEYRLLMQCKDGISEVFIIQDKDRTETVMANANQRVYNSKNLSFVSTTSGDLYITDSTGKVLKQYTNCTNP